MAVSDDDIRAYVDSVLNNSSLTDAQRAATINQRAAEVGVDVGRIASAVSGKYTADQVYNYLGAPMPSPPQPAPQGNNFYSAGSATPTTPTYAPPPQPAPQGNNYYTAGSTTPTTPPDTWNSPAPVSNDWGTPAPAPTPTPTPTPAPTPSPRVWVEDGLIKPTMSAFAWAMPTPAPAPPPPTFSLGNMQQSTDWVVDPKTQTVAGQLEKVIASDSPLLQQARARARQEAAQRGLLNSSMAETGADAALYDTALKIATPDAGTYADAAKTNAGSRNQFSLQANDFTGRGALAQYQTAAQEWLAKNDFGRQTQRDATLNSYDLGKLDKQGIIDLAKLAATSGYDLKKVAAQGDIDLAKLTKAGEVDISTAKAKAELDTAKQTKSDDAAGLRQATVSATSIMQTMQNALADLDKMEGLDAATRTAKANEIKSTARAALQIVGAVSGDIDIASYMDALFVEDTPKDPNAVRPGNVTAAGPQADVAAVFKEADRLAALNGTTRAQEIWKWANSQNYTDAEMDTYFSQPAGTAAQVRKQLGK